MNVHLLAFELHRALLETLRPGDALDQRRLAGTVVAEQGDHLAAANLERDVVEREHGAEALRGTSDRERGRLDQSGAHAASSACRTLKRSSTRVRKTSASTASRMTTPMATSW